jgi:hypothetical protein
MLCSSTRACTGRRDPGRLDVMFQYTVKPVTGFALIDTWISGKAGAFRDALAHLALPATCLPSMRWQDLTADARRDPHRARPGICNDRTCQGQACIRVVFVHILPNISGTLLTVIALAYASLLEGAVLTETVFAWPGIGRYLTTAMFAGDMPAILGATLVVGICFVLLNALTDLAVSNIHAGRGAMSAIVKRRCTGPSRSAASLAIRGDGSCDHPGRAGRWRCWRRWIAPYDPTLQETANRLMPPTPALAGHRRLRPRYPLAADLRRAPDACCWCCSSCC